MQFCHKNISESCVDMFLLLFIVISMLGGFVAINDLKPTVHWQYLHYHKTGHDLAIHFGKDVFRNNSKCNVTSIRLSEAKVDTLKATNVVVLARGEYTWHNIFFQDGHHFKIVHFARDPYDMIVSGFLYHTEKPPPKNEDWLSDPNFNPCKHDMEVIKKFYLAPLLDFIGHSYDLTKAVSNVYYLCHKLQSAHRASTYGETLSQMRVKNVYDGIRYETCRALSDILLMAANAHQENQIALNGSNSFMSSRRVYTSDFPVFKKDVFRHSTESLFDFLLSDADSFQHPFYGCMNKTEIVDSALSASYSKLHIDENSVEVGRNKHITSNLMSTEERLALIGLLQKDEVLAPLLDIARAVLFDRTFNESMKMKYRALNPSKVKFLVNLPLPWQNDSHFHILPSAHKPTSQPIGFTIKKSIDKSRSKHSPIH